jgi:hypothetical protein
MTGIELIAKERQEQIEKHGWTPEHDDEHSRMQLTDAAAYLLTKKPELFPDWDYKYWEKFRDKKGVEALKVAGALIAAEIDRLLRAEE